MNFTCDLATLLAIIGTGFAIIGFVYGIIRNLRADLDKRIDDLTTEIRTDRQRAEQRTDQLYQMFIDLLKSQKPKTDP